MDLVYDVAYAGYDRAIDSHIKNLRRKIEPDPDEFCYIITVYGVGYKMSDLEIGGKSTNQKSEVCYGPVNQQI
jgi:DNA-binding response OmpR family regulator